MHVNTDYYFVVSKKPKLKQLFILNVVDENCKMWLCKQLVLANSRYSMQYLLEEAQLAEEVGSKSESQTSDFGVKSLSCKFLFLSRGLLVILLLSLFCFQLQTCTYRSFYILWLRDTGVERRVVCIYNNNTLQCPCI